MYCMMLSRVPVPRIGKRWPSLALCTALIASPQRAGLGAQDTVLVTMSGAPLHTARLVPQSSMPLSAGVRPLDVRLAGLADGRFLVYDGMRLRSFSDLGTEVSVVAQRGDDSAGFASFTGMGIVGDTAVAVYDERSGRLRLFGIEGGVRGDTPVGGATVGGPFGVDTAGRAHVKVALPNASGSQEGPGATWEFQCVHPSRPCANLAAPQLGPHSPPARSFILWTPDGDFTTAPSTPLLALLPAGGVAWANSFRYTVFVAPREGPVLRIERPWKQVVRSREEMAEWEQWARHFASRRPAGSELPVPPDTMVPPLRGIHGDDRGRVWVSVAAPARTERDPVAARPGEPPPLSVRQSTTFDIVSSTGAYLAQLTLPPSTRLLAVRGDRVWLLDQSSRTEMRISTFLLVFD